MAAYCHQARPHAEVETIGYDWKAWQWLIRTLCRGDSFKVSEPFSFLDAGDVDENCGAGIAIGIGDDVVLARLADLSILPANEPDAALG
jgi:hypothetical protein